MMVFVDSSALYAFLDRANVAHEAVLAAWDGMVAASDPMMTTNYVVVEVGALCQRRLGMEATRELLVEVVPLLLSHWVEREAHEAAVAALVAANRRELSLVDCVSFEVMRRLGIRRAFTLDEHFREQGFEVVP